MARAVGATMIMATPDELLKIKIENSLWLLCKNFGTLFDSLMSFGAGTGSDGIVSYLSDILKENDKDAIRKHVSIIRENRGQLKKLLSTPQVKQRSEEWYALRRERLTASDTGQAMNRGHYGNRDKLIENKAFPETVVFNATCPPLKHGTMFEDMTARCYSQRNNNIKIYEFGLIPHPTLSCYGASPDGITEMGVMTEIKTPWRRKVNGDILEQYRLQMQGQMAVAGITECDFIDCEMEDLRNENIYRDVVATNLKVDHGIILECVPNEDNEQYLYSPENMTTAETIIWKNNILSRFTETNVGLDIKIVYWKLRKMMIKRVYFDNNEWTNEIAPAVQKFWDDVIKARESGIGRNIKTNNDVNVNLDDSNKKQKFLQFIDSDEDD